MLRLGGDKSRHRDTVVRVIQSAANVGQAADEGVRRRRVTPKRWIAMAPPPDDMIWSAIRQFRYNDKLDTLSIELISLTKEYFIRNVHVSSCLVMLIPSFERRVNLKIHTDSAKPLEDILKQDPDTMLYFEHVEFQVVNATYVLLSACCLMYDGGIVPRGYANNCTVPVASTVIMTCRRLENSVSNL